MMLCTYDRYMREFRLKRTAAKYERMTPRDEREVVAGAYVALTVTRAEAQAQRQAVKDSCRGMGGS